MYKSLFTLASLALTPLVAATGSARVVNNCDCDVTLWSVGSGISQPYTLAPHGGTYSERFVRDPQTGGKALKITLAPDGLYSGAAQTVFAYTLDPDRIWYDLSDVFGDAFAGHKLVEASAEPSCPSIVWPNGTPPAGSQVKTCGSTDKDVTLTLCAA
jgi:hypothetical protein